MDDYLLAAQIGRFLQISSGFFWTITYILVIVQGVKDRKVGIPVAAVCANITWEALFLFVFPIEPVQIVINAIWFLLDCVILVLLLKYAKSLSPSPSLILNKYTVLLFGLVIAFLMNFAITVEFHDMIGKYTAFGMNFMMSLLFIDMLLKHGTKGQSITIGYTKLIGTLCSSILFAFIYPDSMLLLTLFILIFILDVAYIILLRSRLRIKV